jgi:two-component system, OmpR family, copper resistance phosphate regulon response regulator CusR
MALAEMASGGKAPTRYGRLRKVLVVDSDPAEGDAVSKALDEAGYYLNLVRDPVEGARRCLERAYDLVIVSASLGQAALLGILETVARRNPPPAVVVLAGPAELSMRKDHEGVPCLTLLRKPAAPAEIAEAARILVGPPWTEQRRTG